MLVAGSATLGGVLALNRFTTAEDSEKGPKQVSFKVDAPPKKPKPRPRKARQRRRPKPSRTSPAPPPPNLSSQLSGVDVGLQAFVPQALDSVSDSVLGDLDQVVHTEETVDERPVPRVTSPIEVPTVAREKNISGALVLSLLIGADGQVRKAKILEAEPPGIFDEAVLAAVRSWEFEPATYRGQSVEVWARLPIRFDP